MCFSWFFIKRVCVCLIIAPVPSAAAFGISPGINYSWSLGYRRLLQWLDFRPLCVQMGYSEIVSSSWGYGAPLQEARLTILNLQLLSILWHPSEMLHLPSCLASHLCTHCLLLSYFRKALLPQWWLAMDHLPTPLFPKEIPRLQGLFSFPS